jgi:RNA polymerase sigma-70 factor (ECF subfamily)
VDSDETLVTRCRDQGDDEAFAELVRRYRDKVFRLSLSILGQGFAGDAEEVAQEVFVRAYLGLKAFRGESEFGSWLYRIAFNQAVNLKARVRYRAPHLTEDALASAVFTGDSPHARLEASQRRHAIAECISELPEVYQAAIRLHYWMGSSIAEVATLLGVPENTVKSYLHRARRLLHAMLQERGFSDAW